MPPSPELGSGFGCPLNAKIARTMKEILEAERENQALLEDAISVMSNEIRQLDAGGKAVKAYQVRPPRMHPAGTSTKPFEHLYKHAGNPAPTSLLCNFC